MDRSLITPRLGLRPAENRPSLAYGKVKSALSDALKAAAGKPSTSLPSPFFDPTVDYIESFAKWDMLGNDSFGSCNAVTWANQRRLLTAKLGKKEVYPDLAAVIEFYKTQNPQFDPNGTADTNGPESEADGGMYIQQGLDYLRKSGGPDGVKPIAFAKVDPKNIQEVHEAISIFGSVWIGFTVFESVFDDWRAHRPFAIPANAQPVGGHAVLVGGYVPNMKCVTWASTNDFDDGYWKSGYITEAWVVIWPEHVGTRSFMLGVNLGQLVSEMKDLTGATITLPSAPFSDLFFIKTRNVDQVELHLAGSKSSYAIVDAQYTTPFTPKDRDNGVFNVDAGDLYYVKTRMTDSGRVELHRTTAASNYLDPSLHAVTAFDLRDADNGTWTVEGGDLYFIKTKNTSGHVEVHRVAHTDYMSSSHHATAIPLADAKNGVFLIYAGNLFFVKYRATASGKVEVHRLGAGNHFNAVTVTKTWFDVADGEHGTWEVGANADLYFVKTKNTGSGRAEVHIASAASGYQEVKHYASPIDQADAPNGTWCIP